MKKHFFFCASFLFSVVFATAQEFKIPLETLKDKIKGGWAGQTIGVTYGAPVEFKFQGTIMNDYQKLQWYDGFLKKSMIDAPGIYDDLYMDITFVEVFEKEGLNAPALSHAKAVANAGYMLWHANQAARYNILHGILPPMSGYWTNNPHADCIDYQIEADYAGLMSPAMPNTASEISDKIGHIMNYGDGWYGGVFVGAMYSLAFTNNDIKTIVNEALKAIPENTTFHKCISDVIKWHKRYPNDWKQAWFEIQKKWTDDVGCPAGVFSPFNIDAKVNSAYVVLGLLYGNGDYSKTLEIATRAGQDADCNPSTAGGILGTMLGYDKIPSYWKMGLKEAEDIDFKYTHSSLNKVYEMSFKQAMENIKLQGGRVESDFAIIKSQIPKTVKWEQSFENMTPVEKRWLGVNLENEYQFDFEGNAFVVEGECKPLKGSVFDDGMTAVFNVEMYVDGKLDRTFELPVSFTMRSQEMAWKYQMENKKHTIKLKILNPDKDAVCSLTNVTLYTEKKNN